MYRLFFLLDYDKFIFNLNLKKKSYIDEQSNNIFNF